MSNRVHVVSVNSGIWFVASSREKVKARFERELELKADGKTTIAYENEDDEPVEGTIDEVLDRMYDLGGCGSMLRVLEEDLCERGDDYVELSVVEIEVDAEC
jgi:hypothetical protein